MDDHPRLGVAQIGYAFMDRLVGAPDALAFARKLLEIEAPEAAFDAAFSSGG